MYLDCVPLQAWLCISPSLRRGLGSEGTFPYSEFLSGFWRPSCCLPINHPQASEESLRGQLEECQHQRSSVEQELAEMKAALTTAEDEIEILVGCPALPTSPA